MSAGRYLTVEVKLQIFQQIREACESALFDMSDACLKVLCQRMRDVGLIETGRLATPSEWFPVQEDLQIHLQPPPGRGVAVTRFSQIEHFAKAFTPDDDAMDAMIAALKKHFD